MVAQVIIQATAALEAARPNIDDTFSRFEDQLNSLPPEEVEEVVGGIVRALHQSEEAFPDSPIIAALTGGGHSSPVERVETAVRVLVRSFAYRRSLLINSVTAPCVAKILDTSRQTSHDRVKAGTMLAVKEGGALRFPIWQLDPDGEDGVVAGLPAVIQSLNVTPLAKVSWLTRANAMLDGKTPLESLKAGQTECVIGLARAVEVT